MGGLVSLARVLPAIVWGSVVGPDRSDEPLEDEAFAELEYRNSLLSDDQLFDLTIPPLKGSPLDPDE